MKSILLTTAFFVMFNFLFGQNKDWAGLLKYQQANEALAPPAPGDFRIVMMGNSITEAWSRLSPEFMEEHGYINRGISGQTTPQMLIRFRPDVIELQPSVVVILAGTNDIAQNTGYISHERILGNIKSMCELARAHKIQVVLCSVLPAVDFPWRSGLDPADKIRELNSMIRIYAFEQNIPYVDYYSALVDDAGGLSVPEFTTQKDLVHPNAAGYAVMESLLQPVLESLHR